MGRVFTPTQEQLAIRVGDPIVITQDDGSPVFSVCRRAPYQHNSRGLPIGDWLLMYEGRSGGYLPTRCWPRPKPEQYVVGFDPGDSTHQDRAVVQFWSRDNSSASPETQRRSSPCPTRLCWWARAVPPARRSPPPPPRRLQCDPPSSGVVLQARTLVPNWRSSPSTTAVSSTSSRRRTTSSVTQSSSHSTVACLPMASGSPNPGSPPTIPNEQRPHHVHSVAPSGTAMARLARHRGTRGSLGAQHQAYWGGVMPKCEVRNCDSWNTSRVGLRIKGRRAPEFADLCGPCQSLAEADGALWKEKPRFTTVAPPGPPAPKRSKPRPAPLGARPPRWARPLPKAKLEAKPELPPPEPEPEPDPEPAELKPAPPALVIPPPEIPVTMETKWPPSTTATDRLEQLLDSEGRTAEELAAAAGLSSRTIRTSLYCMGHAGLASYQINEGKWVKGGTVSLPETAWDVMARLAEAPVSAIELRIRMGCKALPRAAIVTLMLVGNVARTGQIYSLTPAGAEALRSRIEETPPVLAFPLQGAAAHLRARIATARAEITQCQAALAALEKLT